MSQILTIKPAKLITLFRQLLTALIMVLSATVQAAEQGSGFDHFATGFPLIGRHTLIDCSSCHIAGQFKGTPMECGLCHNNVRAPGKHPQHIPTSDFCDNCHTEYAWTGARFDHTDLTEPGACTGCHDGVTAVGMSASHITVLAGSNCDDCHNTIKFDHVTHVDHTSVNGTCDNCHNGIIATGKHPQHVVTNAQCDNCHITATWQAAFFDHSLITTQRCSDCHIGDRPATDVHNAAGPLECDACHDWMTNDWNIGIRFDHSLIPTVCSACHGNDKPANHIPTIEECGVCHLPPYTTWTGAITP